MAVVRKKRRILSRFEGAIVHDHFDGSAHCVECGGNCVLTGGDLLATALVRELFEGAVVSGNRFLVTRFDFILRQVPFDMDLFWRRAEDSLGHLRKPLTR